MPNMIDPPSLMDCDDLLQVALIHNQEANRLVNARQCAKILAQVMGCLKQPHEVWWQPKNLDLESLSGLAVYDIKFSYLFWRWSLHLGRSFSGLFSTVRFYLSNGLLTYTNAAKLRERCHRRAIEIALAAKHIQAWEDFLNTEARFLVVMESDVALSSDTALRLEHELKPLIENTCLDQRLYVDLAGGCTVRELGSSNLLVGEAHGFQRYAHGVSNTACVYLISKPLAEIFVKMVWKMPGIRQFNADWLMNLFFLEIKGSRQDVRCYHASPPIFRHGSVEALYQSEIR